MASRSEARHLLVGRRIEEVSGIRPVTLLIASGIALITLVMIATGIAANNLRRQALATAESDLVRVDSVLAEALNRSLAAVNEPLGDIAARLAAGRIRDTANAPEIDDLLRRQLGRLPRVDAVGLIAMDGSVLNHAGVWPAGAARLLPLPAMRPGSGGAVGKPIGNPQTGAIEIPLLHPISGPSGAAAGAIVALVPSTEFTSLFAVVPLPADAVIALRAPDGSILARYPATAVPAGEPAVGVQIDSMITATIIRHFLGKDGDWQIEAVHRLAGFAAAVTINRSANQVLAAWAHQGMRFAAFALANALAIAIMVYSIARQFKIHAMLAEMRAERIEAEKIESERARLAAEAELLKSERLSVLGQLTATVAHELRNPLSALRNTLFTVKELAANAGLKLDRPVERMERSIERCNRIIADLLEYTRNRDLNCNDVRFDRWLAELLADQPIGPPIVFTRDLDAGDATVAIDPDRFRRVVINLLENAVQALAETPDNRAKHVMVHTAATNGELVLLVEDSGPGIAPDNLGKIFEPLFSTKSFGTGLGLPTVKQIVNQHGGTIEVHSTVGRGTRVVVRLPLATQTTQRVEEAA